LELLITLLRLAAVITFWASIIFAGLMILRVVVSWLDPNPFGWLPYHLRRLTEPMVAPLRPQLGGRQFRFDLMPLVAGVMILITGLFISSIFQQFANIAREIYFASSLHLITPRFLLRQLIIISGTLYVVAIFLRFFLPFLGFGYRSALMRLLFVMTEPLLKPLRRFFVAGMFDFSPLVAMFIIQVLTNLLADMVS
jgi:YggT family protein